MPVRPAQHADLDAVILVWHEAKRAAYGFLPQERDRSLEADRGFFRAHILPRGSLFVAIEGGTVAGFLAIDGSYVDRLYVHPDAQRRGVGGALLARALALSPAGIELHTHQRNAGARAFYEKQGFRAVRFAISPPPESESDIEYHWRPPAAGVMPGAATARRASARGRAGTAGMPPRTPPRT